jgi:hypothetical protein
MPQSISALQHDNLVCREMLRPEAEDLSIAAKPRGFAAKNTGFAANPSSANRREGRLQHFHETTQQHRFIRSPTKNHLQQMRQTSQHSLVGPRAFL